MRDQVTIEYRSPAEASAHRTDFLHLGRDLSVYDDEYWAHGRAGRRQPVLRAGHRGRLCGDGSGRIERAQYSCARTGAAPARAGGAGAIGVTRRQEQAVERAHAGLLALLVAVAGGLGDIGLTHVQSLGSPVNFGIEIAWGV